jgi:hypothetical protein
VYRTPIAVVLSAVTILVAAFGLSGCGEDRPPAATPTPSGSSGAPPGPPAVPLPPPTALTDVLARLADVTVPGTAKVALVEDPRPDDAAALDRFGRALADNGFTPPTFDARDMAWAVDEPGDIVATVVVTAPDPAVTPFTFPMEFSQDGPGWRLTRATADDLFALDAPATASPTR